MGRLFSGGAFVLGGLLSGGAYVRGAVVRGDFCLTHLLHLLHLSHLLQTINLTFYNLHCNIIYNRKWNCTLYWVQQPHWFQPTSFTKFLFKEIPLQSRHLYLHCHSSSAHFHFSQQLRRDCLSFSWKSQSSMETSSRYM